MVINKKQILKNIEFDNSRRVGRCGICENNGFIGFRDIRNKDFHFTLCYKCYREYIKFDGNLQKFIASRKGIL